MQVRYRPLTPWQSGPLPDWCFDSSPERSTWCNRDDEFPPTRGLWKSDGTASGTVLVKETGFVWDEAHVGAVAMQAATSHEYYCNQSQPIHDGVTIHVCDCLSGVIPAPEPLE